MSRLLAILGEGIKVDTAELIWHWIDIVKSKYVADKPQAGALIKRIINHVKNKKTDKAESELSEYILSNPDCFLGRLAQAAIHLSEGRINEAIGELEYVYTRQPGNTIALYALGHCYERTGDESRAVEFYQDCLKFKGYLQLPRQRLAAIYFKNGQLEKAIQEYEMLRTDSPDNISILITAGYLYIAAERYGEAVETFNTAILVHPDNFNSEDDRIERLIAVGQLEDAAQQLEFLMQEQPDRAELLIRYGDVLSMLGSDAEAIDKYEEALCLEPNFLEATIKLGTQYLQVGDDISAAKQFNKALEINDQVIEAYIGLTIAQILKGNNAEAMETLSLAATIIPNSSLLFAQTAVLQLKSGIKEKSLFLIENPTNLLNEVIETHKHQITQHSQDPELHFRLGILLTSSGRLDEAVKEFNCALEINPTFSRARNYLVLCLFETGHKDISLNMLRQNLILTCDMLELHYKIALLYCDKIKFASSMLNFENFLDKNLADSNVSVNVSVVLQNLGLLDRSTMMWENLFDTAQKTLETRAE